jgi:hypothetical protein
MVSEAGSGRPCARVIEELVSIVQDPAARKQHPEAVAAAIRLLGTLRAAEACDALASVISFPEPLRGKPPILSPLPLLIAPMPAIEALTEIGSPALWPLLSAVEAGEYKSLGYYGAAEVIRDVLGKRLALVYVQDAIDAQQGSQQRARLETLKRFVVEGYGGLIHPSTETSQ